MRVTLIILIFLITSATAFSQAVNQSIQTGNQLYRDQKYGEAATQYNKAIKLEPANTTASYNLANALYRENKQSEAIKTLVSLTDNAKDNDLRSKSYYNKGVVLSKQKRLEESIEAYKSVLRLNPNDQQARENLQKALLELKKQTPPPKKDPEQEKKKKKEQQQQQQQKQPKMNPREAEQRLKLLEQKEKEVQQRIQNEKSKTGGGQPRDW